MSQDASGASDMVRLLHYHCRTTYYVIQNSVEGSQQPNSPFSCENVKGEILTTTEEDIKGHRGLDNLTKSIISGAKTQMILDLCTINAFPDAKEADAMAFECIMQSSVARGIPEEDRHSESRP